MTVLGALTRPRPRDGFHRGNIWTDIEPSDTYAGQRVDTSTALQLLTVFGCVRFICDGISTLPVDVFRRRGDVPEPVATPQIITEPAPGLDFASWATQVLSSLLLCGNAYVLMQRQPGAPLAAMIPLDPTTVQVRREQGRKVFTVAGVDLSVFEVGHLKGMMWAGSDVGLSPLEAARQTIGQGMSAQEYAARFFSQDATPSGVIEVPGEMPPEKTKEMARAWARKHAGKSKVGLPGVLTEGATWKPAGVTNEQAQFLESRKFTASEIASQMFLIDPSEMGLPVDGSSITYANLEQRNARKVQVTFLPWITRLEAFLTALLPRPQYVKLNVNGLLRGDMKTRFESYAIGIENRFMTPNQARELEDWRPLPGGDEPGPAQLP